jgi:hypothetical protein
MHIYTVTKVYYMSTYQYFAYNVINLTFSSHLGFFKLHIFKVMCPRTSFTQ